jgi:regulator of sigma E protease
LEFLSQALAIAMVVIGLGFVIFIHELGHFLLAKWNGVKVEKFAVGFDFWGLKLYSRQYGETVYVLGAIPLGGYVKMLGGEDEPSSDSRSTDPRAYHNRPVGARMAIISAGVIMNLIFGLLCFTYVYLRGKEETQPVIGSVIAGMPAYEAGLQPGDRILKIDGKSVETYSDISHATIFSAQGQILVIDVKRPGQKDPVRIELSPHTREGGLAPSMGATSAQSLSLIRTLPFLRPPGLEGDARGVNNLVDESCKVVSAGPEGAESTSLKDKFELEAVLLKNRDRPVRIGLECVKDTSEQDPDAKSGATRRTVELPPNRFVSLGLRLTPGPIVAIREHSPASEAGFKEGDRILSVDGDPNFNPMRLPDLAYEHSGDALVFEVERPLGGKKNPEHLTITAKPDSSPIWAEEYALADEPLDVPGLGLALKIEPKIASVEPDSPASKAGLKPGEVLKAVLVTVKPVAKNSKKSKAKPEEPTTSRFVLDGPKSSKTDVLASWPVLFDALQRPVEKVELELASRPKPVEITPEPVSDWFNPDRGLHFQPLTFRLPPQPLPSALARAWGETVDNVSAIYYLIRGLFQQRLSKDAVGGPIKIADWAYSTAQLGFDAFVPFLAILSINLAVINFLPIPPLDGGQFLLLLAEKIYGRPLPERAVGPFQLVGLVLLLLLIVLVNLNDVLGYFF